MLPRLIAILAAINIAFSNNALDLAPANINLPESQPQAGQASQNFGALPSAVAPLDQIQSFPGPQPPGVVDGSKNVTVVPITFTSTPAALTIKNAPIPVAAAPEPAVVQLQPPLPPISEVKTAPVVTPLIVAPAPAPAAPEVLTIVEPQAVAPAPAVNQAVPAQTVAPEPAPVGLPPNLEQKTAEQKAIDEHNLRLQQKGNVNNFNNVNARQIAKDAAINRSFIAQTGNLNLANNVLLDQRQTDGKNLGWVVQRNNNNIANFANIRQVREGEGDSFARVVQKNNKGSYNVANTKQAFKNTSYGNVAVTASMKGLKTQVFAVKTQLIELNKNRTAKAPASAAASNMTQAVAPTQPGEVQAPVAQDGQAPSKSEKMEKILQIQKEFFGSKAPAVAVAAPSDGTSPEVILLQNQSEWVEPVQNPPVGSEPSLVMPNQQTLVEQPAPQSPDYFQPIYADQYAPEEPHDVVYQGQFQESQMAYPEPPIGDYNVPLAEVIEPSFTGLQGKPIQEGIMIGSALGSTK